MRRNLNKKHSTKQERIVYEALKELHIPFRHRWIIHGREIDFVIGKVCLEIDGHKQDGEKNHFLAALGYTPIHLSNSEVTKETVLNLLKKLNGSISLS